MGKLIGGIFGRYHGKIGNLVFYQRGDDTIVRMQGQITAPSSESQLSNRGQFAVATHFVTSVLEFLRVGWSQEAMLRKSAAYHRALSYHKMNATKPGPNGAEIDYTKVLVAKGSLPPAQLATVILDAEGLLFSWFTDQEQPQQSDWDQVMLLAYYPESDGKAFTLAGVLRSAGSMVLEIPEQMREGSAETYIAFVNSDRTACSDSVYTGRVVF